MDSDKRPNWHRNVQGLPQKMAHFTLDDLPPRLRAEAIRQLERNDSNQLHPDVPPSPAKPQPSVCDGPLATPPPQAGDSAFYVVRVESLRVRLLDTDNLVPKWHVDALRYAGCLPSDAPDRCQIVTTQKKVQKKDQERTLITVERHAQRPA